MTTNVYTLPDATRSRGDVGDLGILPVPTDDGALIPCVWVPSIKSAHVLTTDHAPAVVVFLCDARSAVGMYSAMPPAAAREMAAALIRSADLADAEQGIELIPPEGGIQ